jgi:hypothetical protein
MRKIAIGIGLAGLLLVAANTSAQAMPVLPLSKATVGGPSDLRMATMLAAGPMGATALQVLLAPSLGACLLLVDPLSPTPFIHGPGSAVRSRSGAATSARRRWVAMS